MPEEVLQSIRPQLVRVRLIPGQVLVERRELAQQIFFLSDGLVCLMANEGLTTPVLQLAMIGREGCVGLIEVATGSSSAYSSAVVQVGGTALRLAVPDFRQAWDRWAALREIGLVWVQDLIKQIMDGAASNAQDTLRQRYVRWLVMAQERLGTDDVQVTHDALAAMLCVRRSGVTVATSMLQEKGLIQSGRARIRILDPEGLRRLAGASATMPRADPEENYNSDC